MKKKFDFSAEMSEVESIKTTPKNEYLEEEKRLLDVNAKELASLNNNVYKLRTEVENLSGSIRECKPIISEEMHKLAVEFGARLLCNFLGQIESKCKEAERRMKKADNAIPLPYTAFYILRHYKIFCVNGNTGFRNESRIFYFIHLQNEEAYERKESSSA